MPMFFSLPVLMYHSISDYPHKLCVSPLHFEEQCRALTLAGWRGVSLLEVEYYLQKKRDLPPKSCLITFDDGYLDNYVYAVPILREYKHTGVFCPVLNHVEDGERRATVLDRRLGHDNWDQLPDLHAPATLLRSGIPVRHIHFCRWSELHYAHERSRIAVAPHSLNHDNVALGPEFFGFFEPVSSPEHEGYFSTPPVHWPLGMPRFALGSSLASRAFVPSDELLRCVTNMVPQEPMEAAAFFSVERNAEALLAAVQSLPSLGAYESEAAFRLRLSTEFARCRSLVEEKLSLIPATFCLPWGLYSPETIEEGRKIGFTLFLGSRPGYNAPGKTRVVSRFMVRSVPGSTLLRQVRAHAFAPLRRICGWFDKL